MNRSLIICVIGVLFAGPAELVLAQSSAPDPSGPSPAGTAKVRIKACRPLNTKPDIQEAQAIAEPPPAPAEAEPNPMEPQVEVEVVPESAAGQGMLVPAPQFDGGIHPYYYQHGAAAR